MTLFLGHWSFLIKADFSFVVGEVNSDESATGRQTSKHALEYAVVEVGDDTLGDKATDNDKEFLVSSSIHGVV